MSYGRFEIVLRAVLWSVWTLTTLALAASGVAAQEATPATMGTAPSLPAVGDPQLCLVEPRAIADYEALVGAATAATPQAFVATPGEPADQATIDAITATMVEVSACYNAGQYLRLGALYTDAGLAEDNAGIDEATVAFFAASHEPAPTEDWFGIVDVTAIHDLPDGRVGAIVVYESGDVYAVDYMIFAREGDRYLIDHWVDEPFDLRPADGGQADATPAA